MRFERDERIAGIVANWPRQARFDTARGVLKLPGDASFESIVRQYIEDMRLAGQSGTALKGLS